MTRRKPLFFGNARKSRRDRQRRMCPTCLGLEPLESRQMMAHVVWDGGGDDVSWADPKNWVGDKLPTAADDVSINVATNPMIRVNGIQSIRSLVSNEAMQITGGSLRIAITAQVNNGLTLGSATLLGGVWDVASGIEVTGSATVDGATLNNGVRIQSGKSLTAKNGASLNGSLKMDTNASLIAASQVRLTVATGSELSNVNLKAREGGMITLTDVTTMTAVNLTAQSGGQITLPALTTFTSNAYGNTLQANGQDSKIDLSSLTTFSVPSLATPIKAENGGTVILAGQLSGRTVWTVDGSESRIDADRVTRLDGGSIINVKNGAKLNLPGLSEATNLNLTALSGGQITLPALTTFTSNAYGNTLQANGQDSKIDLSSLTTFTVPSLATPIKAENGGTVILAGQFSGRTVWTVDGAGSTIDVSGVSQLSNASLITTNGATWVLPAGWVPKLGAGNLLSTSREGRFVNEATLSVEGVTLTINTSDFTNRGTLNAAAGGVFDFNGSFRTDDPGILSGVTGGVIAISGDLLGNTRNADHFSPQHEVRFDGTGAAAKPQQWEVMGRDLGPYETGFVRNFAFGTVKLAGRTYVRLTDAAANTASGKAEAVYVDTLVVPAGTTLDLNGLQLYARKVQIAGTILNGNVEPIVINSPPTDLELSNSAVAENLESGAAVGVLSTTDPDAGDTFTYALVSGDGDADNSAFAIDDRGQLTTTASFDYEAQDRYTIRVRTTDQTGLWLEKTFSIGVIDVEEGPLTQMIAGSPDGVQVHAGETFRFDIHYSVSDNGGATSGLGLRMHYDSQWLTFSGLADVMPDGYLGQATFDDTEDYDGDAGTDQYVLVAWADLDGDWPNVALPAELAEATFRLVADAAPGSSTDIRFTAASTAAGYEFASQPVTVTAVAESLDIDSNGQVEDAVDGELIMRYLFGFRGQSLTGSVVPDADPMEITARLDSIRSEILDVDGNGQADALTDGVLIRRYLNGRRGADLERNALGVNAQRREASAIEDFLAEYVPGVDASDLEISDIDAFAQHSAPQDFAAAVDVLLGVGNWNVG